VSENSVSVQYLVKRFPTYQIFLPIGGSLLALAMMLVVSHLT
jgi:hypothetical protein